MSSNNIGTNGRGHKTSTSSMDLQIAMADLHASRARLREVLVPPPTDPNAPKGKGVLGTITDTVSSLWNSVKGSGAARSTPGTTRGAGKGGGSIAVSWALAAVQSWWARHPWRQIGNAVAAPLGVAALPLVRRYPWAAVTSASVVGALFVMTRPWRWGLVSRQAHVVRRQAVRWALSQVTRPAVQALIATALASALSSLNQKKTLSTPATKVAADKVAPFAETAPL